MFFLQRVILFPRQAIPFLHYTHTLHIFHLPADTSSGNFSPAISMRLKILPLSSPFSKIIRRNHF
ncbi:MAG: hypothetical protein B6245_07590 [Desulfobacteraceae bacterium 4572_88]|nr:MAG: hypothetical protein B6245_07590 [Desulfobacteraceae bacterium 4572_88]